MASTPENGTGPTEEFRYAGSRLGLPEQGSGSVAGWGRRVLALFLDWVIAGLVASAITGRPMWAGGNDYTTTQLVVFFAMTALLVGLAGATIGHRVCGLRVITTRPQSATTYTAQPGLLSGALRAFLVCLVIPAVVYDRDRRGLHDQAASTVVVKR
ncbi:putative RDD family membrane protein YckC [Kribbella sp. VKM Ac-2527]|uniref:Putative RDD family membrane protein YckC n=1 Tax=Kribbella caucasensis TaxID=2512215 RepID=A0A4R6K2N4_9ACTN|nr:RDD family protein [Kribbella sp. VKM Ac-2527]TDO43419.1 putative RDD family membrane protein YckC [Kribbella sp. VKM Ac-2527]